MDRRRVGGHQGVEFAERIGHLPAVERGDQRPFLVIDPHHRPEIAVEDLPVIVVLGLHHPVARREAPAKPLDLGGRVRVEHLLKLDVEVAGSEHAPVHRAEHLHVLHRIEPEPARHALLDHLDDLRHALLGLGDLDEVEVALLARLRRLGHLALVDPVGIHHDPALRRLPEHLGQPSDRDAL